MNTTLGSVVLRLRESQKLTRLDIEQATRGEIKQSWLAHFEKGMIKHPDRTKMEPLVAALGATMHAVYQESGFIEAESPATNPIERDLVDAFRALSPSDQRRAVRLLRALADDPALSAPDTKPSKRVPRKKKD